MTDWIYDDGGREDAGFRGVAGDCAVRAAAIATERPYREVYDDLYALSGKSPRLGVYRETLHAYLDGLGWAWTPTMGVGSGCRMHLAAAELPGGRIIVRLSKHYAAVIDGVLRDITDCSRGGTRCVYGYWRKG